MTAIADVRARARPVDGGDEHAWRAVMAHCRAPILRYAQRHGLAPHDAEDAVQDAFLATLRAQRAGRHDPARGRLDAWCYGIARRVVLRARRRLAIERRRVIVGCDPAFWAARPGRPDRARERDDDDATLALVRCRLERAQTRFGARTCRAFEGLVVHGRSAVAVARELGITRNAVYIARHRMVRFLRGTAARIDR